jgi:hypothetical protein
VEAPAFDELQSEMKGTRESESNALSKAAGSNR